MGRPVFFYSAWPLRYHNAEAARKARALAAAGYEVTYVAGVGIRNPAPSNLPKLLDRVGRVLTPGSHRESAAVDSASLGPREAELRQAAVIVAPPRQFAAMRRLNGRWMARQLRRQIGPWPQALAWVRWPTPELIEALRRLAPPHLVYEAVDAYEDSPGIVGPWRRILDSSERAIAAQADVVVVPGERLAERYRNWGAEVRIVPHGVDLIPWHPRLPRSRPDAVIGFIGTIDARISVPVLRAVANAHPEWRIRLIGPVQDGFDPAAVADLANLSLEPPIPTAEVPRMIREFDLGIMPYVENVNTAFMVPVKNLEYLAAGVPAVGRRIVALEPFRELMYFADSPESFVAGLERALAEDSPELAAARRRVAEPHGWPGRLAEVVAIADEVSGGAR